jgi:hypothetical protein
LIAVNPTVKCTTEGMDFDLGLKVKLPEFEGLEWLDQLKKLLPAKVSSTQTYYMTFDIALLARLRVPPV